MIIGLLYVSTSLCCVILTFYFCFIFLLMPGGTFLTVSQSPLFVIQQSGTSVRLSCNAEGTANPYMYWYKQNKSKNLNMMVLSVAPGSVTDVSDNRFKFNRTDAKTFNLEIESLPRDVSGVYFCASSVHSE
uniref:Ig-like domain-containing protein n=1 Tax=Erpetoichthys calabaricus TaxID=27687 RepID=A0A8C4RRL8_ERPCA